MPQRRLGPLSRLATLLAATACVVALDACKDSLPPPIVVKDGLAGRYTLRTVDGFTPPQIILERNDSVLSIIGGVVILTADSTFVDSTEVQWIVGGVAKDSTEVAKGFFRTSSEGAVLTFYSGPSAYDMERDDDALIQDFGGVILVYRK